MSQDIPSDYEFYDFMRNRDSGIDRARRGAQVWNAGIAEWDHHRYEPKFDSRMGGRANLRLANLDGMDLNEFDLRRVDLQGASFVGASLIDASLVDSHAEYADFSGAICRSCDFSIARLLGARFDEADCRWAQFRMLDGRNATFQGAKLNFSLFEGIDFERASFDGALMDRTVFADCDLSQVNGLDDCTVEGPCQLDASTLFKSHRNLSDVFLRRVGVPEILITYLRSMAEDPIQHYSCFISYGSPDEGFASRLYADLQVAGVRCWYAPEDMRIGDRIRDTIERSIRTYDKLIVVLSRDSVRSSYVESEVEAALEKERELNAGLPDDQRIQVLFPIRLDDEVLEVDRGWVNQLRRSVNIGNFTDADYRPYKKAFELLLRDLRR